MDVIFFSFCLSRRPASSFARRAMVEKGSFFSGGVRLSNRSNSFWEHLKQFSLVSAGPKTGRKGHFLCTTAISLQNLRTDPMEISDVLAMSKQTACEQVQSSDLHAAIVRMSHTNNFIATISPSSLLVDLPRLPSHSGALRVLHIHERRSHLLFHQCHLFWQWWRLKFQTSNSIALQTCWLHPRCWCFVERNPICV